MEWASFFSYNGGKHTLWGHASRVPGRGLPGGVWTSPPGTPVPEEEPPCASRSDPSG